MLDPDAVVGLDDPAVAVEGEPLSVAVAVAGVEAEADDELSGLAARKGLLELPPTALVRSSVKAEWLSCWSISAEVSVVSRALPLL